MRDSSLSDELDSTAPLLDQFNGEKTPCRGGEEVGFYAFPSSSVELERSKSICQSCKFRRDCLRHASKTEESGVWGGKYFFEGKVKDGESAFLGRRSVRTQTDEEMFEEAYLPIPVEKLDAFNSGEWEPPYVEGYEYEEEDTADTADAEGAEEDDTAKTPCRSDLNGEKVH